MPTDLLTTLCQALDAPQARLGLLDAYYRGEAPLSFLSPESKKALNNRLDRLSVNLPRLVVESVAERLRVRAFTDPALWPLWLANDFDQASGIVHREALILGRSYVIVWAGRTGAPQVSVESARQVVTLTDPGTRETVAALKRWDTPTGTDAVLFEPDRIRRLHSDAMGATTGFKVTQTLPNPLGIVPVVAFRNATRLLDDGTSEMVDVLSLSDAVTKLTTDLLTASEYGARPRRYATGVELTEDENGEATNPYPEGDRMLIAEAPEARFGQLPGSDLSGYESAIGVLMRQVSAVTGLPLHQLGQGSDNPTSADSIRASEAAITAKAEARQGTFGRSWEAVARLMLAVQTGRDVDAFNTVRVAWADPSTRSEAAQTDAAVKLVQAGILTPEQARARLGLDTDPATAPAA